MPKDLSTTQLSRFESKITPVNRTSISDLIVDQIMALISSGELKAGQRLPSERELCKKFAAGRSSLREALRCLCIIGVLNARVGEGTSVAVNGGKFFGRMAEWRVITEQHNIEDMMELRMALEGVTAASAARRGDEEDLANLQALLVKMQNAIEDERRFAALDLDFHLALAKASENFLILDLLAMIRTQLANTLSRVLLLPDARPLSLREHTSVVNAIKRRDPEAARKAMQGHLTRAIKRYHHAVKAANAIDASTN